MASAVNSRTAPASPKRRLPARVPEIKTGVDHTRGFTKLPHEYEYLATSKKDADGEFRPMLSGLLQSNLLYWIIRNTFGKESRPEYARLSITQLAQLCGGVERKNAATQLADLISRGIIAVPVREGCAANTPKMYKPCPEKWRTARPYKPEVDPELLALAKAVEAGWAEDAEEESPELDTPPLANAVEVSPGRLSKPQPVSLPVKGGDAFLVRVVYHSEFDEPMAFRAKAGRNGRLQVTACRPAANVVWGSGPAAKADEGKANECSRARPHQKDAFVENKELREYRDYLNPLILKLWETAKDESFIRLVFDAAAGAPLDLFRSQVELKFKARDGETAFRREASRHQPGLLKNLAEQAARAHQLRNELEKARPDKMADNQPQKPPEALDPTKRWDRVRIELKGRLTPTAYNNWFAFTRQIEETPNSVTIAVPGTKEAIDFIREEYGTLISFLFTELSEPGRIIWRAEQ